MKSKLLILLCSCFFLVHCTKNKPIITAPVKEVSETLYGMEITDPYRYMENPEDSTVIQWYKAQDKHTAAMVHKIPGRARLLDTITKISGAMPYAVSRLSITDQDNYYYLKKNSGENTARLYTRHGFDGREKLLFDPATQAPGKEKLINYIRPSWDESRIVIGLTEEDKEFSSLVILDISTKTLLPDRLGNCWPYALGGVAWLPDNSGFLYTYVPDIDSKSENYLFNSRVVVHKIGNAPETLQEVFSMRHNPGIGFKKEDFPLVSISNPENRFALGAVAGVSRYRDTYYTTVDGLSNRKATWKPLFKKSDMIPRYYLQGDNLYFLSAKNSSNFKICRTSLTNPDFKTPEVLVEEDTTAVITDFTLTREGLFYVKTANGVNARLYKLQEGKITNIPLPKPSGYINVSSKGPKHNDLWVEIEGWANNRERYRYVNNRFTTENLSPVITYPELEDVVVREIEIPSHDGVMVPLSVIYKKGMEKNGKNRVLLNGYGAYKWSNSPYLYPYLLHWIRAGGIYAVAHVRGGGEKGDTWHKAGFKTTKPNSWKDFIACTEYLINEEYTTNERMTAWSASAGGITIGRAITARPDLYAAAFIRVGVLNTLRAEFAPNGLNNTKEFGTVKDSIEFMALLEMDAFHHIKKDVKYPAVYLTAGLNDARVAAWQPGKFAARLQAATTSDKPVLLDVDFKGGHGFEANETRKNEELADIMAFMLWQTGHEDYQK
ncbi:prolyl oligopeptidase family serine peptidase [Sinomicrobium sp. M5D2P9]